MDVLHFMNEVPSAFPAALAQRIDQQNDIDVIIASFYNDIGDHVQAGPVEVVSLDSSGRFDISAYRKLRTLINRRDIDIVHTHPNATGAVARLVSATTGVDVVDTRHNDHRHFEHYRRVPSAAATAVTDCYISNSQSTHESFSRVENLLLRLSKGSHEIVYNGIDASKIENLPPEPDGLPETPRVVCVARYTEQKNHETLVRAMEHVSESITDASLILVGQGKKFYEIESLINQLELNDTVVQTGYLPHRNQVFSTVSNSDVFAIPSRYEGFCIAAVEAMLTRTPVVASDIDVLNEVVGDAGVYAPPDDPEAFAGQLISLIEDSERREELGERGFQRATTKFSLNQTAEGYARVYRDLADRG